MTIVNRLDVDSFDQLPSLAIAIAGFPITHSHDRRHVGIIFRSKDLPEQLIHLGFHGDFECIPVSAEYGWVAISGLHPVILDNIADWLPQVWRENGRNIAYSIKPFTRDPFDAQAKVQLTEPGDGFTCATFVLWVFHRFDVKLISLDGWEDRPEDLAWRKWIVAMLRKHQERFAIPEAHITAQIPYVVDAARFRPEEVAGAAGIFSGNPLRFPAAVDVGELVIAEMLEHGML